MALEVTAAVVLRDGHVLACQRRADADHPGKWELPGGKREIGETLVECLRRELREELGIDAEIGPELWRTRHTYAGHVPLELVFYLVRTFHDTPVNHAFAAIRWVRIGSLSELDFLSADRELVERIDRGTLVP